MASHNTGLYFWELASEDPKGVTDSLAAELAAVIFFLLQLKLNGHEFGGVMNCGYLWAEQGCLGQFTSHKTKGLRKEKLSKAVNGSQPS